MINNEKKKQFWNSLVSKNNFQYELYENDNLIENTDRYGLTKLNGEKVEIISELPLEIYTNSKIYNLSEKKEWYCNDINTNLYEYLVEQYRKGNEVSFRLTKDMQSNNLTFQQEKYSNLKVDISNLKNHTKDFKSISYNPQNYDKFIVSIDVNKKFMNIYEFKNYSNDYVAKYIHAIYDEEKNILTHIDYSLNIYEQEQYQAIVNDPYQNIPKCNFHKKIWMVNGKIDIYAFYNILFSMYNSNKKYIEELFKK